MKTGNVILAIFLFLIGGFGIIYGIAFSILGLMTSPIGGVGILAGGGLCLLVSFILIIIGIVSLITGMESRPVKQENKIVIEKPPKDDEVLKTIQMRYAKGEITKEQFEQMKKDLE